MASGNDESPSSANASLNSAADLLEFEYRRPRPAGEIPWTEIGSGSAFACSCLPPILVTLYSLRQLIVAFLNGSFGVGGFQKPAETFIAAIAASLLASGLIFIAACFVALVVLPALGLSMRWLGIRGRLTPISCFGGGCVAFGVATPCWAIAEFSLYHIESWIILLLLPALATLVGQLGSGLLAISNEAVPWLSKRRSKQPTAGDEPIRFSLQQLLLLMVLASLVLTGLRYAGLLRTQVLAAITVWSLYQFGSLWLAVRLVDWQQRRIVRRMLSSAPGRST